jgi:ABC-type bacteriocin/lantibiotic exporter with double-glycine peptidase domain
MDEYNQGWDPEVKRYFRKIVNSFALGALWLLTIATLGFAFKLAIVRGAMQWRNYLFYGIFLLTLLLLLFVYFRMWRKGK